LLRSPPDREARDGIWEALKQTPCQYRPGLAGRLVQARRRCIHGGFRTASDRNARVPGVDSLGDCTNLEPPGSPRIKFARATNNAAHSLDASYGCHATIEPHLVASAPVRKHPRNPREAQAT